MSVARGSRRVLARDVAPLIVTVRGCKAIRDSDLAALFGISLPRLYERIGPKLWRFQPTAFYKLPKAHDRGRLDKRPVLAFTLPGVLIVASLLADDDSLAIGMDIARALKNQRRASAHKKRPAQRTDDPDKAERYYQARARIMQGRLHELLKKQRRH